MAAEVLQRLAWNGTLQRALAILFALHENRRAVRASIFTHHLGWEVRLLVGSQPEVVQTKLCRTQDEVLTTGEQWRAAMIEKGWR
jgi:hypothetical protein